MQMRQVFYISHKLFEDVARLYNVLKFVIDTRNNSFKYTKVKMYCYLRDIQRVYLTELRRVSPDFA